MIKRTITIFENRLHQACLGLMALAGRNVLYKPYQVVDVPVRFINNAKGHKGVPYKDRRNKRFLFSKVRFAGIVLDGDWDIDTDIRDIESEYYAYIGMKERFLEGKSWEETVYYRNFLRVIGDKTVEKKRGCETWDEYKQIYLARWDRLYEDVERNGYKRQIDLGGRDSGEVQVCVGRTGEVLFLDGIHRLGIAKLLGIEHIPVIVNFWHFQYIERVRFEQGVRILTPLSAITPIIKRSISGN